GGQDPEGRDHAGDGAEEPEQGRQRDDRVEHGQVASQPAHLGLRRRFHRDRGGDLSLGQARGDHAGGHPARVAGDLERLVELAALRQLQGPLGRALVTLTTPESEPLNHDRERHDRAAEQGDHHGPAPGERLNERSDLRHGPLTAGLVAGTAGSRWLAALWRASAPGGDRPRRWLASVNGYLVRMSLSALLMCSRYSWPRWTMTISRRPRNSSVLGLRTRSL